MNRFMFTIFYCSWLFMVPGSLASKCPFSQRHNLNNFQHDFYTEATTILEQVGMKRYLNRHSGPLHAVKPVPAGLSYAAVDEILERYFQPNRNHIKKRPFSYGDDAELDSYLVADKTEELDCALPPQSCSNDSSNHYYRSIDGSCNNLVHPGFGMANTRYSRLLPPKYGDGHYSPSKSLTGGPLPNARLISLSMYGEDTLADSYRTLMYMQFGQYVAHDISKISKGNGNVDCCANPGHKMCYSIALHPMGPIAMTSGKTCMSFTRSITDADLSCPKSGLGYAEKITQVTAFLDLSSIYGNSLEQAIKIRSYKGGMLKMKNRNNRWFLPITGNTNGECPLASNEYCYNIADGRNQETPTVAVIHTIFVREHNRLAHIIAQLNPHYSDERIFQEARKINIAQYQKIAYYDWLPMLLGPVYSFANRLIYQTSPYEHVNDYDHTINPAPIAESASAALRYAHNMIPGWFSLVSPGRNRNQTMRLSDYFDRQVNVELLEEGDNFECLVRGLTTQQQKKADSNIDRELKHHLERKAFDEFGLDLKAMDIHRGRDFGLRSYNDLREYCGLTRAYDWTDFANEISQEKIALMRKLYATPNDVDLGVGGSMERHVPEALLGPTFQCIVSKQFVRTRKADRFFFENENIYSGFTKDQLAEIRKISLASLLCANSDTLRFMQPNVFAMPNRQHNNPLLDCRSIPQLNLRLWTDRRADRSYQS